MNYALKTRQVCLFIIAFLPLSKLFVLPSVLAKIANEDLWLCTVLSLFLDFITLSAVLYACKKADTDFFGLLRANFGKVGEVIVLVLFLIYFTFKAINPLTEQNEYVKLTLYTLMPTLLYFLPFFIVCFYLCTKKLRILGRAADIMWLATIIGVIILFAMSISNADFSAILPIGARGFNAIIKGSYKSLNWFGDSAYLLFFIGRFKYKKRDYIKIICSYLIHAVIVTSFVIIFYSIFTSIAYRQRFALTEISKYTVVINNMGRFDYVGIMLILLSNMFSLSLPLYFSCKILNRLFNFKRVFIAPIIVVSIQVIIMVFLNENITGFISIIQDYGGIYFLIVGNILPVFSALLKPKEKIYANQAN